MGDCRKTASILSILVIFMMFLLPVGGEAQNEWNHESLNLLQEPHDPITIDVDVDLEQWPGEGTIDNPHIISGLRIESDAVGIHVFNTRLFFKIIDCEILADSSSQASSGIKFDHVKNGAVEACQIEGFRHGIELLLSSECKITSITIISTTEDALTIHNSDTISVDNSTILDSDSGGVIAYSSSFLSLSRINIKETKHDAIRIDTCDSFTILGTYIDSTLFCGISIYNSQNSLVSDCEILSTSMSAIQFELSRNVTILSCEVFDCVAGIEFIHCFGVQTLDCSVSGIIGVAIHIYQTPSTVVSRNIVNDCGEGIILSAGSDESLIESNLISNIMVDGIYLGYSENLIVQNNSVLEIAEDGLESLHCYNVSVATNTFEWSESWAGQDGIRVDSCDLVAINRNHIFNARDIALHIYGSTSLVSILFNQILNSRNDGVHLSGISNATVFGNAIESSHGNGFGIDYSENIHLSWNRINGSGEYNLYLSSPRLLKVYMNAFYDSGISHVRTRINTNASWHNGTHGNYWDDYIGDDMDGNGIGDSPYEIGNNLRDPFPLMNGYLIDELILNELEWNTKTETNATTTAQSSTDTIIELLLILSPSVQIVAIVIIIYELKRRDAIVD